ncbi:MAG TPA: CPBP family intramembrane glutamic endopeptidase [Gaiellaceae bacterium]|nr:CPBP family intramembrane glutamic endopeptidase [Gaiellaceae bacterium]
MAALYAHSPAATMRTSALKVAVPLYVAGIAAAEVCVVWVAVVPGVLAHAVLVFVLVNHYVLAQRASGTLAPPDRPRTDAALIVLAVVPLVRITSLATALDTEPVYQYAAAGLPLLAGGVAGVRLLGVAWFVPKLRAISWRQQAPIALSGMPLGYAAFLIARPEPLVEGSSVSRLLLAALIVVVCTGFAEELLFRGVCQRGLSGVFGRFAYLGSTFLFAIAYLGVRPAGYAVFVVVAGLAFGFLVEHTRSLLGVALAHALMNVGLLLVWPALLD